MYYPEIIAPLHATPHKLSTSQPNKASSENLKRSRTLHSLRRNPKVLPPRIPRINHPLRFQQHHPDLLVRFRTVLHTPRDHEYLPGLQDDVPIPQLDIQRAVYDEEQLVGVRMGVPDEFAQQLGELDFVVVEGADCALGPVVREAGEEMLQVEGFHVRGGLGD